MNLTMNQAWKILFDKLDITERLDCDGEFSLTADKIKKLTGKEPRVMSKWDSRDARPEVLRDAGVTVLPTSRQGYVLLKGDGYFGLPAGGPSTYHSPERLEPYTTLPWRGKLTKEPLAIDVALASSMLRTFTGEKQLALTIRGRSGTPQFAFQFDGVLKPHRVTVDRAQVEIDAGFEGDRVWLVEAKIGEPEDFLVRQLFYPWRLWKALTTKEVIPVFLTYSNRSFGFFRYRFLDENRYHSIELVEKRWYTLDAPAGVPPLDELYRQTHPVKPPTDVFPQADTLGTVIAAVEHYADEATTAAEVSKRLGFDPRQGAYYTAAAEWLGLARRHDGRVTLTQRGAAYVRSARGQRFKVLFQAIVTTPVFREAIAARLANHEMPEDEIADRIRAGGYAYGTTPARRAKTVVAWLNWLWREHANLSREASEV